MTRVGKARECVDLNEWVAPWGHETSGEYVRGAVRPFAEDLGSDSEVGPKPEEGHIA